MPVFNNALAGAAGSGGAGGYKIERSLRFNDGDSAYLNRTSSGGNRKKWTWSAWVKRSSMSTQVLFIAKGSGANPHNGIWFEADRLTLQSYPNNFTVQPAPLLQDTNAWYHFVVAWDTTQSTASNRIKIWINGVLQDTFNTAGYPSQDFEGLINDNGQNIQIGQWGSGYNRFFDGYMAEVHFVDGAALDETNFGEFDADTGVWNPIKFSGNHNVGNGVNGFYLDFADNSSNSALGNDAAGNNNFTVNNFSAADGAPVSVGSASGALPIHNTTDTYGATKGSGLRTDANASNIVLALPLDTIATSGQASDVHATIKGSGSNKVSYHNVATDSNDSYYYGSSCFFDGSQSDSITHATSTDFEFGTGDWTVEVWARPSGIGGDQYLVSWTTPSGANGGPNAGHAGINIYQSNWRIGGFNGQLYNGNEGLAANTWVHVAMAREGNALRIFINGNQVASKACSGIDFDSTSGMTLGRYAGSSNLYFTGYMQDLRVYKGVAKYKSSFKVPAQPNTTVGINCDSLFDSPTNVEKTSENSRGNYCTMSYYDNKGCTVSNGNLEIQTGSSKCGRGSFWASSGKWYFEFEMTQYGNPYVGIASVGDLTHYAPANAIMVNNNGVIYHQTEGNHQTAGRSRAVNATGSYMCAFDLDNNKIWWGKDGTWYQFTASSPNTTTTLANVEAGNHAHSFAGHPQSGNIWTVAFGSSTNACTYKINTGQRPYKYPESIPSGFKSLCTGNLDDPLIEDGSKHFDATLYTGNGGTKTVSGLEFEGDFFWLKSRSNGHDHWVFDRNRGLTKAIYPNENSAEYDYSPNGISATSSTGFTLNGSQTFNSNNATYVGWAWNAGNFSTNSAYNQSAVWSDMCSPAPSIHSYVNGFDGNLNTVFAGGISANSYFTFTPTGGLSFTSTVRVRNGGVNGASYKYNGGSAYSLPANTWTTVASGGGTMTSLAVTRSSTDVHGWYAIEVDGKILVDRGLVGTGSLNSTSYNTGRMWSDGITNGNSEFDQNKTNAFNGNRNNKARTGGNAVTVTINFSPALAVSNTIEMLGEQWATADFQYTATVGGKTTTQNVIGAPCVFNVSGNLTQLTIRSNNSQSRTCLEYIKVDGKELINSDTTPPNFPAISGAVQANPTAGISVVKYVGNGTNKSSIPHGLGKEPEFIIAKNLDTGYSWAVYTKTTSPAGWLKLDVHNAYTGSTGIWGNTYPDSNVFYVGGDGELNQSGKQFIAYCFAQTPGFLATGRYDGHVSGSERPFIATGFRPRFIMLKSYSHATEWRIFDTARDVDNQATQQLFPDAAASETAAEGGIDIYSNGFRVRDTSTGLNTSGVDYIYLAFAENPFKIARAR